MGCRPISRANSRKSALSDPVVDARKSRIERVRKSLVRCEKRLRLNNRKVVTIIESFPDKKTHTQFEFRKGGTTQQQKIRRKKWTITIPQNILPHIGVTIDNEFKHSAGGGQLNVVRGEGGDVVYLSGTRHDALVGQLSRILNLLDIHFIRCSIKDEIIHELI